MNIIRSSNLTYPIEIFSEFELERIKKFFTIITDEDSDKPKTYYHYSIVDNRLIVPKYSKLEFIINRKLDYPIIDNKKDYDEDSQLFNDIRLNYSPRNKKQNETMKFLKDKIDDDVLVSLSTGSGKTILTIMHFIMNNMKPIIFCHNNVITSQWVEKITDAGIPMEDIGILQGGKSLNKLLDKRVLIVSTPTMESKLSKPSTTNEVYDFYTRFDPDLLVVDEAHKMFNTISKILLLFHARQKILLTATPVRSLRNENDLIEHVFPIHNEFEILEYEENIDVAYVTFDSNVSNGEKWYVALMHKYNFSSPNYIKYMLKKPNNAYFELIDFFYNSGLLNLQDNTKNKALIVGSTLEQLDYLYNKFSMKYPEKRILKFYGEYKKKSENIPTSGGSEDIILCVSRSIDAGFDVQDLTLLLNTEYIKSKAMTIQLKGRLARSYEGKNKCLYLQLVDLAFDEVVNRCNYSFNTIKEENQSKELNMVHSNIIMPLNEKVSKN